MVRLRRRLSLQVIRRNSAASIQQTWDQGKRVEGLERVGRGGSNGEMEGQASFSGLSGCASAAGSGPAGPGHRHCQAEVPLDTRASSTSLCWRQNTICADLHSEACSHEADCREPGHATVLCGVLKEKVKRVEQPYSAAILLSSASQRLLIAG